MIWAKADIIIIIIEIKYTINVMHLNHPQTISPPFPCSVEKLSSTKSVSGAKMFRDHCCSVFLFNEKKSKNIQWTPSKHLHCTWYVVRWLFPQILTEHLLCTSILQGPRYTTVDNLGQNPYPNGSYISVE